MASRAGYSQVPEALLADIEKQVRKAVMGRLDQAHRMTGNKRITGDEIRFTLRLE